MFKRFLIIVVFISLGTFASYNIYNSTVIKKPVAFPTPEFKEPMVERKETITLTAAGDCLMHNTQIWSGLQPDGSYRFDTFFTEVKNLIEEGDYSSTNLEAALAGPGTEYSGYPLFNSPDAVADTFKEAGFDIMVTASNHSLDKGVKGALRTLDVFRKVGLDTVGTYKSEEESRSFLIKDIRGVKVAYLAYTYGTNGIPVSEQYSYLINFLDEEKIFSDIRQVRPQVDVVVLVLHWGLEYNPKPTQGQKNQAYKFFQAGADVILGSHPHVIQTMEIMNIDNKDKFVIYSMGNFISHQIGLERNSGIVLKMKFTKDFADDETVLDEVSYTPTFSHSYSENGKTKFRVVPVEATIEKIKEGREPYLNASHLPALQAVLASTRAQLDDAFIKE